MKCEKIIKDFATERLLHLTNFAAMNKLLGLFLVGQPLAVRNQAAQTVVDMKSPCAGTVTVAFDGRNQANARKAEFGLVALLGNLKDNVRAFPFALVFDRIDVAFQDAPNNFLA
jgi:hypothetical protein